MGDLFRKGIEEFNTQCFFEAHDTWEELWRETSGPDRLFYQGLIQTAVGLYHLSHGNIRGARSQFGKALDKLERYLPAYHGIDTVHLTGGVRACLERAGTSGAEHAVRSDSPPVPEILMSSSRSTSSL
jgi:hypothetical protein